MYIHMYQLDFYSIMLLLKLEHTGITQGIVSYTFTNVKKGQELCSVSSLLWHKNVIYSDTLVQIK